VEHLFRVMQLGFVKVRDRGLRKNAHRSFVTCTLVNLFTSRKEATACCAQEGCWGDEIAINRTSGTVSGERLAPVAFPRH
jgi:hypothetical protein